MVTEKIKEIKRSFRLYMNGVTAHSMREKGVEYHLNWGASLQHLQLMAEEYGKDYALAVELWKENIRECKLLATMIMPQEQMDSELAMLWIEQIPTQEVAEYLAFNLLQHVDYALELSLQLLAEKELLPRICAYNILCRLIINGKDIPERDKNEIIDQATAAMNEDSMAVKLAAQKVLDRLDYQPY